MTQKSRGFNAALATMHDTKRQAPKAKAPEPVVPLVDKPTPTLMMDLILLALRVGDDALSALATELLVHFGEEPVRLLALTAGDAKNGPRYRVRLLEAIGRIGVVSDASVFLDLCHLTRDRNAAVRAAAAKLIETLQRTRLHGQSGVAAQVLDP
jgi:hypothetical protein